VLVSVGDDAAAPAVLKVWAMDKTDRETNGFLCVLSKGVLFLALCWNYIFFDTLTFRFISFFLVSGRVEERFVCLYAAIVYFFKQIFMLQVCTVLFHMLNTLTFRFFFLFFLG
jgi:hypothetical protein